jgi:hypothetical protein
VQHLRCGVSQLLRRAFERERTVRLRLVCFLAGLKSFSIWRSVAELVVDVVRLRRRVRFDVLDGFFRMSFSTPSTTPWTRSLINDMSGDFLFCGFSPIKDRAIDV